MDTVPHCPRRTSRLRQGRPFPGCGRLAAAHEAIGKVIPVLLFLSGTVEAQQSALSGTGGAGPTTAIYAAADFDRYDVLTATDILRRIPGASAVLNMAEATEAERGFGSSGDQILINGRRIAGKSNEIMSVLGRIQASLVERVELIRGISPDLEVRSEGLIVNVVLKAGAGPGSVTTWQVGATHLLEHETRPVASLSHGGDYARVTYVVGAELSRPLLSRQVRPHRFFSPEGNLIASQDEIRYEHNRNADLSASLLWRLGGASEMRLNGLVQRLDQALQEPRDVYLIDSSGTRFLRGTDARRMDLRSERWELGGDYQHPLPGDRRFNALFVYSRADDYTEQVQSAEDAGRQYLVSLEQTEAVWQEAIARSSIHWPLAGEHSFELGAEVALNELDTRFQLFTEVDGETIQVDLFNASSDVREMRWQAFSLYNLALSSAWSLQAAVNIEASEIAQAGADIRLERKFTFLKPRVDLNYQLTGNTQLRLRAEKAVSQLEFANFVAAYDFDDDQVRAGNPNLVPEETWEYEVALSRRSPGNSGTFDVRLYYHDIDNLIDRVAATPTRSMRGNLDGARRMGGELSFGLRLDRLGFPDVILNGSYLYEDAVVTDPLTGAKRNFTGDSPYDWTVGFRHDMASPRISYGMDLSQLGPRSTHEVTWYRKFRSDVEMSAFLEARIRGNTTLMVEGRMLRWDRGEREQLRFVTNRGDGTILRSEWMQRRATPALTMSLRGTF